MMWLLKWFLPTSTLEDYYWDLLSKKTNAELQRAILDTITDIQINEYS